MFDKLIIGVTNDNNKDTMFSIDERAKMIDNAISQHKNVSVHTFKGLLMDFAESENAIVIIRGLRVLSDFEYEFKMALMNRNLNNQVTTLFMMPHEKYTHISSSLVKEVASLGGDVSAYVPQHVEDALQESFSGK